MSSRVPRLPPGCPRPKEGWALFAEGARFVLSKWELLHTAVAEEWGGHASRAKFDHIVDDLLLNCEDQWREGHDLHLDTLDEYLVECLEADFNMDFEDDTVVTQCSSVLAELYRKCAMGCLEEARALLEGVATAAAERERTGGGGARRPRAGSDDDEDGDEDGSGDEDEGGAGGAGGGGNSSSAAARGPRRVVDDDGWETIVPKKGGGGRGGAGAAAAGAAGASAAAAPGDGSTSGGAAGGGAGMDVDS